MKRNFQQMKSNKESYYKQLYAVQQIEDQKIQGDQVFYLIKWKGYSQRTWQPLKNLTHLSQEIRRFKDKRKDEFPKPRFVHNFIRRSKGQVIKQGNVRIKNTSKGEKERFPKVQQKIKIQKILKIGYQGDQTIFDVEVIQIEGRREIVTIPREYLRLLAPTLLLEYYQQLDEQMQNLELEKKDEAVQKNYQTVLKKYSPVQRNH